MQRVTDYLDEKLSKRSLYPPLFPTTFDPDPTGDLDGVYSYGGQADSYYEYLIKQVQLLGGTGAKAAQYARMVSLATRSPSEPRAAADDRSALIRDGAVRAGARPGLPDDDPRHQRRPRPEPYRASRANFPSACPSHTSATDPFVHPLLSV